MAKPHELVRRRDLHRYFPYRDTQLDLLVEELLDRGLLKKVKLRASGRAIAFTLDSIADCQAEMGLEPDDGDDPGVRRPLPRARLSE